MAWILLEHSHGFGHISAYSNKQPRPGISGCSAGMRLFFTVHFRLNQSRLGGIPVDHPGARDHDDQGDEEQGTRDLPEDKEGQRHTDEGRDRVISAGLRRAEVPLGNQLPVYLSMENRQKRTMTASLMHIGIKMVYKSARSVEYQSVLCMNVLTIRI